MNKNSKKSLIRYGVFSLVIAGLACLTGCSPASEWTETMYEAPNWTPSGKIVATKIVQHWHKDAVTLGDQLEQMDESHAYIVEMSADGSNERELFETARSADIIQVSTSENYIAYTDSTGVNLRIYTYNGTHVADIVVGETIYSFDWSPDESKIVVQAGSDPLVVYTVTGNLYATLSTGAYSFWKYAQLVVFKSDAYSPNRLAFRDIEQSSDVIINISGFSRPQYVSGGSEVCLFRDNELVFYDINQGTTRNVDTVLSAYSDEFIAPDGTKVVANKIGDISGFWLIDVSSNVQTKLRK